MAVSLKDVVVSVLTEKKEKAAAILARRKEEAEKRQAIKNAKGAEKKRLKEEKYYDFLSPKEKLIYDLQKGRLGIKVFEERLDDDEPNFFPSVMMGFVLDEKGYIVRSGFLSWKLEEYSRDDVLKMASPADLERVLAKLG